MHSQEQWAKVYNLSPATISRWEKGFIGTNWDVLVSIVLSTRMNMDYLWFGVVPDWAPQELRDLLFQKHPALTTQAAFGASLATQSLAGSLRAQRPPRKSRRRFRKPKS